MKMQNKLAVVLAAAALLALGATSAFAAGWVQEGSEWRYIDNSGDYVTDTMKKSGTTTFYLDENGYMAKDFFTEYNENKYYFGANGAMVTNTWVAIDPSLVDNDDMGADVYWFYFAETGKAVKGNGTTLKKKTIDGKTYGFDEEGKMLVGWIDENGQHLDSDDSDDWYTTDAAYYAGADGALRGGWLAWTDGFSGDVSDDLQDPTGAELDITTMYFYFNPSNYKLTKGESTSSERGYKEKTINGKKYRFNDRGLMLSGWMYLEDMYGKKEEEIDDMEADLSKNRYYSGADDGHLVRKGWIYAVPSVMIDSGDFDDDEEEYFYANNNGNLVINQQKRINGKYYVFDKKGIMQTGLIILDGSKKYVASVDTEYTDGSFITKAGFFFDDDPNDGGKNYKLNLTGSSYYSIHYFGDDGAKITGNKIVVEMADDNYVFASKNKGGNVTVTKKKFYSNGFLLKAAEDIRLGLVIDDTPETKSYIRTQIKPEDFGVDDVREVLMLEEANLQKAVHITSGAAPIKTIVVNASGTQKKKGKYKDADGNFWIVNDDKNLVGIFDCDVKWASNELWWKSDFRKGQGRSGKELTSDKDDYFQPVDICDKNGNFVSDHKVPINNDYCLNFYVNDILDIDKGEAGDNIK